jgi:hypothetical protein
MLGGGGMWTWGRERERERKAAHQDQPGGRGSLEGCTRGLLEMALPA